MMVVATICICNARFFPIYYKRIIKEDLVLKLSKILLTGACLSLIFILLQTCSIISLFAVLSVSNEQLEFSFPSMIAV